MINLLTSASFYLFYIRQSYTQALINLTVKADREGGRPLELSIEKLDINGFTANQGWSKSKFMPPSIFYAYSDPNKPASSDESKVTN